MYSKVIQLYIYYILYINLVASLVAQMVKRLSIVCETRVQPLGWEDPLEKKVAIHSRTTAK